MEKGAEPPVLGAQNQATMAMMAHTDARSQFSCLPGLAALLVKQDPFNRKRSLLATACPRLFLLVTKMLYKGDTYNKEHKECWPVHPGLYLGASYKIASPEPQILHSGDLALPPQENLPFFILHKFSEGNSFHFKRL